LKYTDAKRNFLNAIVKNNVYWKRSTLFCCRLIWFQDPFHIPWHRQDVSTTQREERPGEKSGRCCDSLEGEGTGVNEDDRKKRGPHFQFFPLRGLQSNYSSVFHTHFFSVQSANTVLQRNSRSIVKLVTRKEHAFKISIYSSLINHLNLAKPLILQYNIFKQYKHN
jgi:hypothetical protein